MSARVRFDDQMRRLDEMLTEMGHTVELAISMAATALTARNTDLAEEVIAMEEEIDRQEKDIENLCLKLLLLQHPVASDLRKIHAAIKMITDMERIGDQAADISELCLLLAREGQEYIKSLDQITHMADAAIKMVHNSVTAFVKKDSVLAKQVITHDDIIDNYFVTMKEELYALMIADPENSRQALDLLMIAKYYERIGDHAVNIAEWVIFAITGQQASTSRGR